MAAGAWTLTNAGRTCLLDSLGADVTATDGNTLTITPHANGIFSLA